VPAEDFAARVKRLAAQRKTSVAQVGYDAHDRNVRGTNPDTFKSAMAGRRHPSKVLIEHVAAVLGVPPEEFEEYRLALAREQLDERERPLDEALANLELFDAARRLETPEAIVEEAARLREEQQPGGAPAGKRKPKRGRAA
jgi:transcriptional regulator with XRE-family HTH domain